MKKKGTKLSIAEQNEVFFRELEKKRKLPASIQQMIETACKVAAREKKREIFEFFRSGGFGTAIAITILKNAFEIEKDHSFE